MNHIDPVITEPMGTWLELINEVGLQPWVRGADGRLYRDLSRIARLELNVDELFQRVTSMEAKIDALITIYESRFQPEFRVGEE